MPNTNSKRKFFAKLKLVEHLVNVHEEEYDIKSCMENESRQRKSSKNEVLTSQKAMDLLRF
jgi:hypothetical protein